jgi:hypothetical protein
MLVTALVGSVRRRGSALVVGIALVAVGAAGCSASTKGKPGCVGAGPSGLAFATVGTLTAGVTTPIQVRIVDRCGAVTAASAQIVLRVESVDPVIWIPAPGVDAEPSTTIRVGPAPDSYPLAANPIPTRLGTIGYQSQLTGAYGMSGGVGSGSVTVAIAEGGVATFPITLTGANRYTLRADSTAYGSAVSNAFTVQASPELAMLVWRQQPQNIAGVASPGARFRTPLAVAAADPYGNPITTLQGLTIGVSRLTGEGALEAGVDGNVVTTVTAQTVDGVATFQDLRVVATAPPASGAPVSFRLRASAARGSQRFQSDGDAFQLVNPADPAHLVFATEPADHVNDNAPPPGVGGTRIQVGIVKVDGTPWTATEPVSIALVLPYPIGSGGVIVSAAAAAGATIGPRPPELVLRTGASSGQIVYLTIQPGYSATPPVDVQVANLARNGTAGTYYLGALPWLGVHGVTVTPVASRPFTVSAGPAYTLLWVASPLNVGPAPRATEGRIVAVDSQGNLASSFSGNLAVSIEGADAGTISLNGAAPGSPAAVAATAGVADARFTFDRAGAAPFVLAADFAVDPAIVDTLALPARSGSLVVLDPGVPARLVFTRQPTTAAAGATIGAPDVRLQAVDVDGDPVVVSTMTFVAVGFPPPSPVVALGDPGGIGVDHDRPPPLRGTTFKYGDGLSATVVFDDLFVGGVYHGRPLTASCLYRLQAYASTPGNPGERSAPFDVTPTPNDVYAPNYPGLAFTNGDPGWGGSIVEMAASEPRPLAPVVDAREVLGVIGNQLQGLPLVSRAPGFGTVVVRLVDANGNIVTDVPTTVYVHLTGGLPGVRLGGTTSAVTVSGVAMFPDLTIDVAGTYQLVATSPDFPLARSAPFDVIAP